MADRDSPETQDKATERRRREAAALRANLARRKARNRALGDPDRPESAPPPPGPGPDDA